MCSLRSASPVRPHCDPACRHRIICQALSARFSLSLALWYSKKIFVRSHDTEETCKGVKVRTDASDSWFDTMSDIFTFSWSAPLYFGQIQPFFCTLMTSLVGSQGPVLSFLRTSSQYRLLLNLLQFCVVTPKKVELDQSPKSDCYCLIRSHDYIVSIARYLHGISHSTLLVRLDTLTSHRANNGSWVFVQPWSRSHEKARHETAKNNVEL